MKPNDKAFYFEDFGDKPIECVIVRKYLNNYFVVAISNTQQLMVHKGNIYSITHLQEYKRIRLKYNPLEKSILNMRAKLEEQILVQLKIKVLFCANSVSNT